MLRLWAIVLLGPLGMALQPATALAVRATADRADDITGYQVHFMYVLPSDGVDEGLDTDGTLVRSIEAFQRWLAGQTNGPRLRVDTFDGAVDITFFRLSRPDAEVRGYGAFVRDQIETELVSAAFNDPRKMYAVYYGGSSDFACGGGGWPWTGKALTQVPAIYLNGGAPGAPPCSANPFASSVDAPGYREFSMLHEIVHGLGFVAPCAPHFTQAGHVSDDPADLMYAGPLPWRPAVLDVGHDDYYGHSIPGCLDLAQSVFLEPSVAGAVAPPRWPSVYLTDSGCDREGTIRSVSANSRVSLNFVNGTPRQLRVYWLDYNGQRQPFGTVEAWQTRGQGTFVTHPWVIADLDGQCVALFATETLNGTGADAVVKAVVRPTVTRVTLSGSQFSPGTHLTIGIEAHHLGAGTLDLFVGILLADGRTVVSFSSPGTVGGVVDLTTQPLSALQRMTAASGGFSTSMPAFLNFTVPETGIPAGSYVVFALFLAPDALTGNALSSDEIAAVDTKVITILP